MPPKPVPKTDSKSTTPPAPKAAAPTKEPAKAPAKEPTKEPAKAAPAKEPTKEPAKVPAKEPTKEPAKAPAKEPTKEPAKAPAKEPTKEPAKVAPAGEPMKKEDTTPRPAADSKPTAEKEAIPGPATKPSPTVPTAPSESNKPKDAASESKEGASETLPTEGAADVAALSPSADAAAEEHDSPFSQDTQEAGATASTVSKLRTTIEAARNDEVILERASLLSDRRPSDRRRSSVLSTASMPTSAATNSGTFAAKKVDISARQEGKLIKGREPFTAQLDLFKRYVKDVIADRPKHCAKFWAKLSESIEIASTEVGLKELENPEEMFEISADLNMARIMRLMQTKFLYELNPVELAQQFDISEHEALDECLEATNKGMMRMCWGSTCVRCIGNMGAHENIRDVETKATCYGCGLENVVESTDKVSVRFRFRADIFYDPLMNPPCTISKKIQAKLKAMPVILHPTFTGSGFRFKVDLPPGEFKIICPVTELSIRIRVAGAATEEDERLPCVLRMSSLCQNPNICIKVEHGKLEMDAYADKESISVIHFVDLFTDAEYDVEPELRQKQCTATIALNHPTFNKYFGKQVISLDQKFEVGSIVLCFTDLLDSTRQYARLGDGDAMNLVQDHFEIIFEHIADNGGRVVKTIGDAVMCSFLSVASCIKAIAASMQAMLAYNDGPKCPKGGFLNLKVGIHKGHALVVPLNGLNDFFGQTVNISARIQGTAEADEIVISEVALGEAGTQEAVDQLIKDGVLKIAGIKDTPLKGVDGNMKLAHYVVMKAANPLKEEE